VSHSIDAFPARNAQEFLEFLRAVAASGPDVPSPKPVEIFLGSHPAALAFVQAPKPSPASFAKENFYGVTAMRFINKEGASRYGRYRILPDAGVEHLDPEITKDKGPDFLFDELSERIAAAPISFQIFAQLANEGDEVNDVAVHWPEDRPLARLGQMVLTAPAENDAQEQKKIIFDPIPRVDGIEPSDDPLLEVRAAVYLLSGRRRRQA
jgi:catalase